MHIPLSAIENFIGSVCGMVVGLFIANQLWFKRKPKAKQVIRVEPTLNLPTVKFPTSTGLPSEATPKENHSMGLPPTASNPHAIVLGPNDTAQVRFPK